MKKENEEEKQEGIDISKIIGGSLNIFGLKIDLDKLLSSSESPAEIKDSLNELRDRLKKAGMRETISDEEWQAGGASISGQVRTRGVLGDKEYQIGVRERKSYKKKATPEKPEAREPFVDIFYEGGEQEHVRLIAELPGVSEKDVKVTVEGKKLTISGQSQWHNYYKEIDLDYPVKEELDITYRNGIIEVKMYKQT